eukprot:GDKJ01025228.1.p1 GENE.GDKJ01025228.1~~GDKJ01025228.1.p1  ORF type:complete len:352 (-),score=55.27 GDKJ01025228.1:42-1061(-)
MNKKKKVLKKATPKSNLQNVIRECMEGCHIVRDNTPWLLGVDECAEGHPDVCVDLSEGLLMFNNPTFTWRTLFCTIPYRAFNTSEILQFNRNIDENGVESQCTTFCALIPPRKLFEVCFMDIPETSENENFEMELYSDVQDLPPDYEHETSFKPEAPCFFVEFPYETAQLCTQGNGGNFTHFYPETAYAYDFRADVGLPILAAGDGEIVDVIDGNSASGIHVKNLFSWNSVMLKLDPTPLNGNQECFVEYVHIKKQSSCFKVGDRVKSGDKICESGDVGFCPEPHLHIQLYRNRSDKAKSVPFAFISRSNAKEASSADIKKLAFVPIAGKKYNSQGLVV